MEELELDLSLDEQGTQFTPDEAAASLAFATTLGEGMLPEMPEDPIDPQTAPDEQAVMQENAPQEAQVPEGEQPATQGDIEAVKAEIDAIRAELEADEEEINEEPKNGPEEETTATS